MPTHLWSSPFGRNRYFSTATVSLCLITTGTSSSVLTITTPATRERSFSWMLPAILSSSSAERLSLSESWLVFEGETAVHPLFSVKKNVNLLNNKSLAEVYDQGKAVYSPKKKVVYEIEGSYVQRCCAVYDDKRRRVAEIKLKEQAVRGVSFGIDVFRLIVQPDEIDLSMAMALVILLDQMFGSSSKRFSTC
ncbi:hypothetical protein K7X08_016074 [Anisodus acutangulus]|uniref:Uncharacterized protein n=1 Tax=Anisodus acutangulus TaxID=402998 RepID=A0A9Q1LFB8_9SOLA|nr:hypothetical protein K7X08_016074 [Anisodus acutangulus]